MTAKANKKKVYHWRENFVELFIDDIQTDSTGFSKIF